MSGAVFSVRNYRLIGISVALLVLGYILLGQGPVYSFFSWKAAPVILVLVYCVLLPWAIVAKSKTEKETQLKKEKGV